MNAYRADRIDLRTLSPVRRAGALAACGVALLVGACAHNTGDVPVLEWQLNASSEISPASALNTAAQPRTACEKYHQIEKCTRAAAL
jgi:hypothetical protein